MKMKPLLFLLLLMTSVGLSACAGDTTPSTQAPTTQSADRVFTATELATFNGQNGQPAYVAVDGVVYDVTNNPSWAGGVHRGVTAGQDVSNIIPPSHRADMRFEANPIVGSFSG